MALHLLSQSGHSADYCRTIAMEETGLDLHGTTAVAALLTQELKFRELLGRIFAQVREFDTDRFYESNGRC